MHRVEQRKILLLQKNKKKLAILKIKSTKILLKGQFEVNYGVALNTLISTRVFLENEFSLRLNYKLEKLRIE